MISTAGALFAISHLGLLGYLIDRKAEPPKLPAINNEALHILHTKSKQVKMGMRLNIEQMILLS